MVKKEIAIELFLYGLILTVFALVGYGQKVNLLPGVLAAGVIAGISIAVLAILALQGHHVHKWCIAAVSIILLCLLTQAAFSWYGAAHHPSQRGTPIVLTVLSFFGIGQLASLVRK
jgi:uncharacterized membrane protein (UPF0136 family)